MGFENTGGQGVVTTPLGSSRVNTTIAYDCYVDYQL